MAHFFRKSRRTLSHHGGFHSEFVSSPLFFILADYIDLVIG